MAMSTTRYCPSCVKVGFDTYTQWAVPKKDEGATIRLEECENLDKFDDGHYTYVVNGSYRFDVREFGSHCEHGCREARPRDDGVYCKHRIHVHDDLWLLLMNAATAEAMAGTFEAEKWAPTFPRLTAELAEWSRGIVAATLADKLPTVLIGIIGEYFI